MKLKKCYIKDACVYSYLPPQPPQCCSAYCNYGSWVACTGGQTAAGKVYVFNARTNALYDSGITSAYFNHIHSAYATNMVVAVSGKDGAGNSGTIEVFRINNNCSITQISSTDPRKSVAGFSSGNSVYSSCYISYAGYGALVTCANNDNSTYYAYYCVDITSAVPTWNYVAVGIPTPIGVSIGYSQNGEWALFPGGSAANPIKVQGLGRSLIVPPYMGHNIVYCDHNIDLAATTVGSVIDSYALQSNDMVIAAGETDQKTNGTFWLNGSSLSRWPSDPALLFQHNLWVNVGTVYANKMATNTNASAITYGSTNITMAIIAAAAAGTTKMYSVNLIPAGTTQYAISDVDKSKLYSATDFATWTLKYTHTGTVTDFSGQNSTSTDNNIWMGSLSGGVACNQTGSVATYYKIFTDRKVISVHKLQSTESGFITCESGNTDADYIKYYLRKTTGSKIIGIENSLVFDTGGNVFTKMAG